MCLSGRRDQVVLATKFGSECIEGRNPRAELWCSARDEPAGASPRLGGSSPAPLPRSEDSHRRDNGCPRHRRPGREGPMRGLLEFHWLDAGQRPTGQALPVTSSPCRCRTRWSLLSGRWRSKSRPPPSGSGSACCPSFLWPQACSPARPLGTGGHPPAAGSARARFQSALTPTTFDKLDRLQDFANERSWSLTRLALSWLASHPVVSSVIAGATSPAQVRENAASTLADLSGEEVAEVARLVES